MRRAQPDQPLLSVVFAVVLPGEHRAIERFHAPWQVNSVLAQVLAAPGRVVAHVIFIVYAIIQLSRLDQLADGRSLTGVRKWSTPRPTPVPPRGT